MYGRTHRNSVSLTDLTVCPVISLIISDSNKCDKLTYNVMNIFGTSVKNAFTFSYIYMLCILPIAVFETHEIAHESNSSIHFF